MKVQVFLRHWTPADYEKGKSPLWKIADALLKAYPAGENSVPKTARDGPWCSFRMA